MPIQQLDTNYRPVSGSVALYNPATATFVAQQGGPQASGPDGTLYAPTVATLGLTPPGVYQKTSAVSTGSVASLAKAFNANNLVGNTIVVVAGCGNGTAMTVADALGNVYTQAVTAPNSSTFETAIFYAVNTIAGANTVTVTNAGTAASMAMEIYEVYGLLTQVTAQPDCFTTNTGTGTTATTSALAASVPNSLAFLGVAVGTTAEAVTAVANTPWAVDASLNTAGTPAGLFSLGVLSTALAGTNGVLPQATIAASKPWAAAAAIFKPAVLGIQGTVTLAGYNYTNITTQTTTLIKNGTGILHSIIINAHGAGATIELDDAITHTTPKIGTITLPATITSAIPISLEYDVVFATGLSITTGVANLDITIVWK